MIQFRKIPGLSVIALVVTIFVTGCEDSFTETGTQTFTQPQPVDTKTLLLFPSQLQGTYLSLNDSSFIKIGYNSILRIYEGWRKMPGAAFDSSFVWNKDSAIEKGSGIKYRALKEKDSISVYCYFEDTVIRLNSATTLLKKFKNNYFLNHQTEGNNWIVKKLSISKGKLVLSSLFDSTGPEAPIDTGIVSPAYPKPLNLSKQAFKKFLRKNNFNEREVFVRQQ